MAANTEKIKYNPLPRPTFRWMKVNDLELEPVASVAVKAYQPEESHDGDAAVTFYEGNQMPAFTDFEGSNKEALQKTLTQNNSGCAITLGEGQTGTVHLHYTLSEDMPQVTAQLKIEAAAHSDLKVFLEFDGDAPQGYVNFLTYVKTGEEAKVKISKVQLHGSHVRHVEHRYGDAGAKSTIDYVSAELGASKAIVYYKTDLMTDESTFNSQAMYLGSDDQVVDFSYWVPMKGVKTTTDINTTGALLHESKKYFRGTIDFLRGGKKAVGSEADTCILLSPKVHSFSVPLLLCKEDDVVGNHASSAGQIDQDKLFYLMSRGFNEEGAQLIIVESNIRPVIDALGDKNLENKALQAVREKMQFCQKKGDCNAKCTQRFPHLD